MKFKSIHLIDFQAHKDLQIGLDPSITTIRGATDRGKSAILRALRWVCQNDFSGKEFIREGAKEAIVALITDGAGIIRGKGASANYYDFNGDRFASFGTGVPDPIAEHLQISEINFQGQFDVPFWFGLSAPEVARRLNSVIDLSIIDSSLSSVAAVVRRAQEQQSLLDEQLEEAESKLAELEPARSRISQFEKLKKRYEIFQEANTNRDQLEDILSDIVDNRAAEYQEQHQDCHDLWRLAANLRKIESRREQLADTLKDLEKANKDSQAPPDFSPVEKACEEWQAICREADDLEDRLNSIGLAQADANAADKHLKNIEAKFHKKIKGQVCPTCGQKL